MADAHRRPDNNQKSVVTSQTTVTGKVTAPSGIKVADGQAALLALLRVEADMREIGNERDLMLLVANEMRKLTRARQIFILKPGFSTKLEVQAISSLPSVDRNAPLVQYIENVVARSGAGRSLKEPGPLDTSGPDATGAAAAYPFRSLMWLPLRHGKRVAMGGIVLAREDQWTEHDLIVATRLSRAFAHAWSALGGKPRQIIRDFIVPKRWHALAAVAVISALVFVKVPLSALAPMEIVPREPFVVAAPIEGVIKDVLVEPNQVVAKGDLLVKLTDTSLRNRLEVAEREVQVAEARLKQVNQIAFNDDRGLHQIAIARTELALKVAERDFARELLDKSEIRAERAGLAIYADKRTLVGKPVAVGERILEVAEADKLEARIDLSISDTSVLSTGAEVKLYLDSEPLKPWDATVKRSDYKAHTGDNNVLSLRVIATLLSDGQMRKLPRLGVRGTAQISGEPVPLGLYLFRRPFIALRQSIGF